MAWVFEARTEAEKRAPDRRKQMPGDYAFRGLSPFAHAGRRNMLSTPTSFGALSDDFAAQM